MKQKLCSFCKNIFDEDIPLGDRATGSYYAANYELNDKPRVFNGYCCDMHADDVDWVSFRWRKAAL